MGVKVYALNTQNGQVAQLEKSFVDNPLYSEYLVEVPKGTKSYAATLWRPQTAADYTEARQKKANPAPAPKPTETKKD